MKKLLALILALTMSVAALSACGSDTADSENNSSEQVSSLSNEEISKILKDNNQEAKTIFNSLNLFFKDLVVEQKIPSEGKYFFELSKDSYLDKSERQINYDDLQAVNGLLSKEDTKESIKKIILCEYGEYFEDYCPIYFYVEVDENGYLESVACARNGYINYAGQYPDSTTTKTTFNIYDLKE